MQTARRIYLYLLSAIGLTVAAVGLWALLSLAFERVLAQSSNSIIGTISEADTRSQLSLALALVAVAGPLWAVHWWFVERGIHSAVTGEAERTAPIRAFYLALVELVSFGLILVNGTTLVQGMIRSVISRPAEYGGGPEGALAAILVGLGIGAFHVRTRDDDERAGSLIGSAAWWPRLAWYLLASLSLAMLCFSSAQLLQTLLDVAVGRSTIIDRAEWWVDPVVGDISVMIVGGATWFGTWLWLSRRLRSREWVGPSERVALIRKAFLTGVIVVGAAATLFAASDGLTAALAWVFGAAETTDPAVAVQDAIGPSIAFLPLTFAWWWGRRRLLAEGPDAWPEAGVAAARRLIGYSLAAVGLAFSAVGAGWLIGFLVDVVLGGDRTVIAGTDVWRRESATYVAFLAVGTPLWLWHWIAAIQRQVGAPRLEAASPQRRVYLYLVLAAAMISSISALALIAYRLFGIVLGATQPPNVVSELSTPIGAALIGVLVVVYHALAMRADLALREPEPAEAIEPPAPVAAVAQPAAVAPIGPGVEIPLVVVGPAGIDPDPALAALRAALPAGYSLRRPGSTPGPPPD
jgi:hypothetical protein